MVGIWKPLCPSATPDQGTIERSPHGQWEKKKTRRGTHCKQHPATCLRSILIASRCCSSCPAATASHHSRAQLPPACTRHFRSRTNSPRKCECKTAAASEKACGRGAHQKRKLTLWTSSARSDRGGFLRLLPFPPHAPPLPPAPLFPSGSPPPPPPHPQQWPPHALGPCILFRGRPC